MFELVVERTFTSHYYQCMPQHCVTQGDHNFQKTGHSGVVCPSAHREYDMFSLSTHTTQSHTHTRSHSCVLLFARTRFRKIESHLPLSICERLLPLCVCITEPTTMQTLDLHHTTKYCSVLCEVLVNTQVHNHMKTIRTFSSFQKPTRTARAG